ncbi:SH3-domain-containing protein [Corynespora cassiicola Philippines]|uniref:SH3-domain-containing protein n=1 Tax=Corynespora cassiicola Philippines TaxID=1448308 RepID=A0A2T2P6Y7_CORCC|nr:SH3-domain-containing protein [Corynespora cassiicola Philippines]
MSDFNHAMTNRSLRVIKTELEFLVDANVISSQQYDTIINQLPASAASAASSARALPAVPAQVPAQVPVQQMSNLSVAQREADQVRNDTKSPASIGYYSDNAANPPPPAYPTPPAAPAGPPAIAYANALYQYNAQDAGDLALMPNDKITVTEYMNNEWWKGRNERTGQEGIFPASYVRRDEKAVIPAVAPSAPQPSNYGNMPLDVSNGVGSSNNPQEPSKFEENGKKFGKKLGNAAIFGAGATIGGKIVNGIF